MKTNYVLGFAFSADKSHVVLIHKDRPEWQAGLLNGLGGKRKDSENDSQAMSRKFAEECGVKTFAEDWIPFLKMYGDNWECFCFKIFDDKIFAAKTIGTENIQIFDITEHGTFTDFEMLNYSDCIDNLEVIIPLALLENVVQTKMYY